MEWRESGRPGVINVAQFTQNEARPLRTGLPAFGSILGSIEIRPHFFQQKYLRQIPNYRVSETMPKTSGKPVESAAARTRHKENV